MATQKYVNCYWSYKDFNASDREFGVPPNESLIGNHDRNYKGVDACNKLLRDQWFSLSSYDDPLIEKTERRHQLREDYLHPRVIYKMDMDRCRDNVWSESLAFHYAEQVGFSEETDHKCRDCGSIRCNRRSECSGLHQDDLQSNIGEFESRRRYGSGGSGRNFVIDKGREDYQQHSFDIDYSSDIKINTPVKRKKISLCQKFLQGQCLRGSSCWYVHDVAGRYHHGHIPDMKHGSRLSVSTKNSPTMDGYFNSADILHSRSNKHQHKRCIRRNADADGLFKKRRMGEVCRREDNYIFEEDGTISRNSVSRGCHLPCGYNEKSWEVRSNETVAENSSVCKASDEPLHSPYWEGVRGQWRHQIGFVEHSDSDESLDSRIESADVNINCTRSSELNHNNEKQFAGKRSRKGSFKQGAPLQNRNSRALQKHYSFKKKQHYHHDHNRLHQKGEVKEVCKYYIKGYCRRGNKCWFLHETVSSRAHLDLDEGKLKSVATNETPPGKELSSAVNSDSSQQKKDRSSSHIDESVSVKSNAENNSRTTSRTATFSRTKCMAESDKHTQPSRGKRCSETSVGKKIAPGHATQKECVDNGVQDVTGDDGCTNYLVEGTDDKDSSVEQIVERKVLFAGPSLLNPENSVSEIPSVNPDSCKQDKSFQAHLPLCTLKQHICVANESEATYVSNKPIPLCSKDVDGVLNDNGLNLNSQSLSCGPEVNESQKAIISNGFEECSIVQRITAGASVGKKGNCVNGDQPTSFLMNKRPSLSHTATCNVTGFNEKVAGGEIIQETREHNVLVCDDYVCDIQERKGDNEHTNNRLFTASCGVRHSTGAPTDEIGEEMLVTGASPFTSNPNSAACFRMPATEEAIVDDIGLDLNLDHYIYMNLSIEQYESYIDDGNKETAPHFIDKEHISFLEDGTVLTTWDSNVHSPLPSCDDISEIKPVHSSSFSSPTRITWTEVEETALKPDFEQHENIATTGQEEMPVVKLEPICVSNTFTEETCLHVHEESSSSQKERIVAPVPRCSDKHVDSLGVAESIKTISVQDANCKTDASKDSEQIQQVVNPKEPAAVFQADEKCISVTDSYKEQQNISCNGSHDVDVGCECQVSNNDEDEKLLLRLAVLELAKKILYPLWKAGRIMSKEIYKSITKKVVDKVCISVQGVNIPKTKESVDLYLLHHQPKIAQLVLAYVNMYPVPL